MAVCAIAIRMTDLPDHGPVKMKFLSDRSIFFTGHCCCVSYNDISYISFQEVVLYLSTYALCIHTLSSD